MVRPTSNELTQRELEVMHVFWEHGDMTTNDVRDVLAKAGVDLAYVTVANLIRILVDKQYLRAINDERPFVYQCLKSFEAVSKSFVGDLVTRVFRGSREALLVQLLGKKKKLTKAEKTFLKQLLEEQD